MTLKISLQKPR